jgi:hypothetical protein
MFSIIASTAASPTRCVVQRQLRMASFQSADKLHTIFEEYRSTNYSREVPKRFHSDIVKAAATSTSSRQLSISATSSKKAVITAKGIEGVLKNIGQDHRMSRKEIEFILKEVGGASKSGEPESFIISPEQMMGLISARNVEN